jgi:hypothetical protein
MKNLSDTTFQVVEISQSVLNALSNLSLPNTVGGLLELANRALGGGATGGASLSEINGAVDAINVGFDECRYVVGCSPTPFGGTAFGRIEGEEIGNAIPEAYALAANFPNPFNPTTSINFDLPEASVVKLVVFNIIGQEVATLVDGVVEAGYRQVSWNANSGSGYALPSGIYLYRISARSVTSGEQFQQVRKMVLMK